MRSLIFCFLTLCILNGCAQYSAFLGPSYTFVDTGSIMYSAINYGSGKYIEKETGKTAYQHVSNAIEKHDNEKKFDLEISQLIEKSFNETRVKKFNQNFKKLVEKNISKTRKKLIKNN